MVNWLLINWNGNYLIIDDDDNNGFTHTEVLGTTLADKVDEATKFTSNKKALDAKRNLRRLAEDNFEKNGKKSGWDDEDNIYWFFKAVEPVRESEPTIIEIKSSGGVNYEETTTGVGLDWHPGPNGFWRPYWKSMIDVAGEHYKLDQKEEALATFKKWIHEVRRYGMPVSDYTTRITHPQEIHHRSISYQFDPDASQVIPEAPKGWLPFSRTYADDLPEPEGGCMGDESCIRDEGEEDIHEEKYSSGDGFIYYAKIFGPFILGIIVAELIVMAIKKKKNEYYNANYWRMH